MIGDWDIRMPCGVPYARRAHLMLFGKELAGTDGDVMVTLMRGWRGSFFQQDQERTRVARLALLEIALWYWEYKRLPFEFELVLERLEGLGISLSISAELFNTEPFHQLYAAEKEKRP